MSKDLSEFKGSMVAIATPMNTDGSLDFNSLERLVEFHIENKTDVIIAVGTTGESATLSMREHSEVIQKTISIVNKRIPVIIIEGLKIKYCGKVLDALLIETLPSR